MLELIAEPMSGLTLTEASGRTDRQFLDVYVYPRIEQQRRERAERPTPQPQPGKKAPSDSGAFQWTIPPEASPDAEVTVDGVPIDPEPFIENLIRMGAVKRDTFERTKAELARRKGQGNAAKPESA